MSSLMLIFLPFHPIPSHPLHPYPPPPFAPFPPPPPSQDIPRVLECIRNDWQDPSSLNSRSAASFVAMLQRKAEEAEERGEGGAQATGWSRKEIDVLVTGVENSLWVAEQFAADLQNCE